MAKRIATVTVVLALMVTLAIAMRPHPIIVIHYCIGITGASIEEAVDFTFNAFPNFTSQSQKCLAGCFYTGYGVIVNDSISLAGYQKYIAVCRDSELRVNIAGCAQQVADMKLGEDRCETGPAIRNCIAENVGSFSQTEEIDSLV